MSILEEDVVIRSPGDLIDVLREVKARLVDGRLQQVNIPNSLIQVSSLTDISDEGPWPDLFEAVLEDYRGQRYRLTVETYHGAGGSWRRI